MPTCSSTGPITSSACGPAPTWARERKEMTMKTSTIFLVTILAAAIAIVVSCGDNLKVVDAKLADGHPDAQCSNCPAAPSLGPQIDRLGRPAINTVLNHGFDPTAAAGSAKDAYNLDGSKGGWS